MAIDTRSKSMPYGARVREIMAVLGTSQNLVVQIEALLKTAKDMEIK